MLIVISDLHFVDGDAGVCLTMTLYAFQIGFMWQHILKKGLRLVHKKRHRQRKGYDFQ